MYRGHEGIRELLRDLYEAYFEFHTEYSEIRDHGDRLIGIGRIRTRGKGSGAETESPLGSVAEFKNGTRKRKSTPGC